MGLDCHSTSTRSATRLARFWLDIGLGLLGCRVMDSVLLVEREGPVATLIMNRPKTRNALDQELLQALGVALREAAADASVRVVVLTGAGDAFCSGADLKG